MIQSVIMILLVAVLLIAILEWLCPMAGIPAKITKILEVIVIVLAIFKLLSALGVGLW